MVSKNIYIGALILTLIAFSSAFLLVKFYDDSKLNGVQQQVTEVQEETDEARLLFAFSQVFSASNSTAFCNALNYNSRVQMDKGYYLVRHLRELEQANLLSSYEAARKRYYLYNFELWLYTTHAAKQCGDSGDSSAIPVVFFTKTRTLCPDCIVQGEILDSIRSECTN